MGAIRTREEQEAIASTAEDSGEESATDEALIEYIKNNCNTVYHPLGSAAMLPEEDGGVVSPELRVYGTANLRVVCIFRSPGTLLDG